MEFNKAYNRQEFVNFLQNSFLPDDFIPGETPVEFRTKMNYTRQAVKLGSSESLDLVVYEVRHNSKNDARVSLSKEALRLLADEMEDRALVIFVPQDNSDNYRFSLIEITIDAKEDSSRVARNYSNPRRYSYFLGEGIAYYTPNKYLNAKGRVVNSDDLRSRFSVEVLTKEFYQELSDWYAWAIKIIRFPNDLNDKTDDDKFNNESAIRLITRLIFVWFLKQRHLVPDEFFDEQYIAANLIEGFNPHAMADLFGKSSESKYYKAILQNLFFAMLNSPITPEGGTELSERHFRNGRSDYDNNKLMRYESYFKNPQLFVDLANRTVPFLNGGLFDCLDEKDKGLYYDGFSDREAVKKALIVPDYLFFGEEVGKNIDLSEWYGDKKKKKVRPRHYRHPETLQLHRRGEYAVRSGGVTRPGAAGQGFREPAGILQPGDADHGPQTDRLVLYAARDCAIHGRREPGGPPQTHRGRRTRGTIPPVDALYRRRGSPDRRAAQTNHAVALPLQGP